MSACVCIGMEGTFNLRKSTLWPVTCKVQVVHMVLGQMGGTLVCMRRQGAEGGGGDVPRAQVWLEAYNENVNCD